MKTFQTYSPTDVINANLCEVAQRLEMLAHQEYAHLREMAAEIVQATEDGELLSSLPDHRLPDIPINVSGRTSRCERARQCTLLCQEVCRMITTNKLLPMASFFSEGEVESEEPSPLIIYQRNSYTDEAFLRFSGLFLDARASYVHSFFAACEAVFNKECRFCILPIENSSEGALNSFFRLIERFDLKIAATCDIFGNASERSTRFALLRRSLLPASSASDGEFFFTFSLPASSYPSPFEILYAAELCSLVLSRTQTLPRYGSDSEFDVHLTFSTRKGDLRSFLLYLAMEAPHHTPIGYYPHLTQKGAV